MHFIISTAEVKLRILRLRIRLKNKIAVGHVQCNFNSVFLGTSGVESAENLFENLVTILGTFLCIGCQFLSSHTCYKQYKD